MPRASRTIDSRARLAIARAARIGHRAAELMVECPDTSVADCLDAATLEEWVMHGDPQSPVRPRGTVSLKDGSR